MPASERTSWKRFGIFPQPRQEPFRFSIFPCVTTDGDLEAVTQKYPLTNDTINKNVPSYISDLFSNDCENNPYKSKLRNKEHNVMLGRTPKTEYCKGSLSYRGGLLWNSLPNDIKAPLHTCRPMGSLGFQHTETVCKRLQTCRLIFPPPPPVKTSRD